MKERKSFDVWQIWKIDFLESAIAILFRRIRLLAFATRITHTRRKVHEMDVFFYVQDAINAIAREAEEQRRTREIVWEIFWEIVWEIFARNFEMPQIPFFACHRLIVDSLGTNRELSGFAARKVRERASLGI